MERRDFVARMAALGLLPLEPIRRIFPVVDVPWWVSKKFPSELNPFVNVESSDHEVWARVNRALRHAYSFAAEECNKRSSWL